MQASEFPLEVRCASSADRDALRDLTAAYLFEFDGQTTPYRYFDAYWSEPERLPFVVEVAAEPAGFCLVRLRELDWTIAEFFVVPDWRRQGVGRRVVASIRDRAIGGGARYVEATVHPGKTEALSFWLACGFRVVGDGIPIVTRLAL